MNSATIIARNRATGATLLFVLFGIVGVWRVAGQDAALLAPQLIAYAALVAQTFFSVRRFSRVLDAAQPWQRVADGLLVATYAGLAWSLAQPVLFLFFFTAMFAVAVVKYASHESRGAEEAAIMHRKTLVDAVGCVACLAVFGITMLYPVAGSWVWATGFVVASVYVIGPGKLYA